MLSILVAALLVLAGPALAEPPDSKLPARFRDIGGLSGKLLAFIETREGLAELEWRGAWRPALEALCRELGETDLLERVPRWRQPD